MNKKSSDDKPGPGGETILARKKLAIAFIYNIRHSYPDLNNVRTQLEADFDDPETIEHMIKHLKKGGFKVIPIEANEEAYLKLYKNRKKIDLAFNFSEGMYGKAREAHIPAMLEMLQIPYTGCSSATQGILLNKARTKHVLIAHKIPTPDYQIFSSAEIRLKKSLKFPLIVKPIAQGSSAGITNKSLVFNEQELSEQVKFVIETFGQEALVETFLSGREFSVSMLGNPPQIMPIIESNHAELPKQYHPFDSLEVKWFYEEEALSNHFICPANLSKSLQKKIEKMCLKTWNVLEINDWCRIDIRCDENENPFVLEVNCPAGIMPPERNCQSYFCLSSEKRGIKYQDLLKSIIHFSLKRYEPECAN